MYVLEDGTQLTENIKNAFKHNLTRAYIKVGNTIINQDNYLVNVKYRDEKADPETGMFIGVTSMRELTIKLLNIDNSLNLENADIEYHIGALVDGEYKYINLGNFIVQKPTNEEVNEEMSFTALDYMSKFDGNEAYQPQISFPATLLQLAQDVCSQAGVTLGNTDFRNANKQVVANPFLNGENMRTVLKSIAKLSFSCGYIGQDNKLYFKFDVSDFSNVTESITIDEYFENKPNDETKRITALTLRSSEIKAAGQTIYDGEHVVEYGVNELLIEEDYIAFTDELRLEFLNGARDLFGLNYKPLSVDVLGNIYLTFNDVIEVTNLQGEKHTTYALNNVHEYNGTLYNTITAPALSEIEERYKYETDEDTSRRRTTVEIDKANQQIQSIVSEIGDRSQKTTTITQDIDGINSSVGIVADLTNTVSGIDPIQLTNCMEGQLVELDVFGDNNTFKHLYPSDDLYPSNTLYPYGSSKIKIYSKNLTSEAVEVQNDHWHNSLMPPTSANDIHTEIYYDSTYTKDWSSTYIELKPNTGYVFVNINAGSNYRGAIFNDFPFSESYTSTNKISSVQYIGDYIYDWGVSSWISRVNEYTYFKTGTEGSWYLVMNGSFGTTGVYEVVDSIFEELDTKIQDSKFALQPTRRIVTTNSYKSLTVKIPKGIKLIKVTKQPSRRFGLATFKYYPNAKDYATNYISNDDYGADVTEYEISVGNDDTYLVVYYYDSDIDNENPTTIKNSIKIYGAYGNYRLVDLQIDEVLRQVGDYRDKIVITNGKELLYRHITFVDGETVIVENPVPIEIQDLIIDLVEDTNYIEVLDYYSYIRAKYVQKNEFTKIFATTYEVNSLIQQLANQLNFKVSRGNIISEINMGIDEENGDIDSYLYMKSNKFKIESDYFNVALDGTIEATRGKIANFDMWRGQSTYTTDSGTQATTEASYLTKYYVSNNQGNVAGMMIPDVVQAKQYDFIFARSKSKW